MSKREDLKERVAKALERLKIFPLPASVLIPRGFLPLHVFEPRYRDMVEDCLAGDRVLAIATLAPGWEMNYEGRPKVIPVLGAGYVENEEKLDDRRYNILLRGVLRVRMEAELPAEKAYREIRASVIPDTQVTEDGPTIEGSTVTLRRLVLDLSAALPNSTAKPLARAAAGEKDPSDLADIVAGAVLVDADQRQHYLEETDVRKRLEIASERVGQMLLQVVHAAAGEA